MNGDIQQLRNATSTIHEFSNILTFQYSPLAKQDREINCGSLGNCTGRKANVEISATRSADQYS